MKKCFLIDSFAFILFDLIVLEKPSQSQEFSFSPFLVRDKHSGIEAVKRSFFKPIYWFRKLGTKLWQISHLS